MATLVLGPILRGFPSSGLTVWVETSSPCDVTVGSRTEPTFQVGGHHYALVDLDVGIDPLTPDPDGLVRYTVELDGRQVWPDPGRAEPPPGIAPSSAPARAPNRAPNSAPSSAPNSAPGRTPNRAPGRANRRSDRMRIMAGSCRQQAPQPLWLRRPKAGFGDLGPDALATLAGEIRRGRRSPPDLLLLTGDQVYADEQHHTVRDALRRRRGGPPADGRPEVTSFEEYTWLYQQTWSHPVIAELLATVPSLMIFDDHDVIDDWNISASWAAEMAERPWWSDRIRAALMSYWLYQHLGNLSPDVRRADPIYRAVTEADDGEAALAAYAERMAGEPSERPAEPWTYRHRSDLVDLVVLDTRNSRVLDPEARSMLSPCDWQLVDEVLGGAADESGPPHVLLVSSVPWALPVGIHRLQQLVSRMVERPRLASIGEAIRRAIDLEHWAAFGRSYERLAERLAERLDNRASAGNPVRGSSIVLSGDVHFGYVAEVDVGPGRQSVHQVVASPLRQVELTYERAGRRLAMSRFGRAVLDRVVQRSSIRSGEVPFRLRQGPVFDNNIATITYERDRAIVALERARMSGRGVPRLESVGITELPG